MKKTILLVFIFLLASALRLFHISTNPPAISWDEASLGYNAFTILNDGKDEFGEKYPLDRFTAFGDYKPPGYIYAAVPSVAVFGLSEFAVRLPSALAGLLLVLISYKIGLELLKSKKIGLLSGFLVAISPWSIQFSRTAFESNLAATFNAAGVYFFIIAKRKPYLFVVSLASFVLSFYSFNANRIIAPIMLAALSILFMKTLWANLKWVIISVVFGIVLLLPSVNYLRDRESRLRFQEVSIFNELDTIKLANSRVQLDGFGLISKAIHNRRVLFSLNFLKHYADNFKLRFLFVQGDVNPRLSLPEMGQLYIWELPFFVFALYFIIARRKYLVMPLIIWMLIVPIPAATAKETPHALRTLSILPTYHILIATGIHFLFNTIFKTKYKVAAFSLAALLLTVNVYYYLHNYYVHYPVNFSGEWQYGYKELVAYVKNNEKKYDQINITNKIGRPYIYFTFYEKYPLQKFLADRKASRDWFGFWEVNTLDKISFTPNPLTSSGRMLLVTANSDVPPGFHHILSINDLGGHEVFNISDNL